MSVRMHAITFDCDNPDQLANFWGAVLERDVDPHSIDGFATIGYVEKTVPFLVFQKVEGGKVGTNRVHADLASKDYETECERVLGLGATRIRDVAENGIRITTFADPEGNQFRSLRRVTASGPNMPSIPAAQDHPSRPTPAEYRESAAFTTTLQDTDGAFAWAPAQPADLGATSTALRIYSECAVDVPRRDAVRDYVDACFDPDTSGFALTPDGPSSLHSIAEGHVALVMLGLEGNRWTHNLIDLVAPLVQTPMDIWIASAFLNTV